MEKEDELELVERKAFSIETQIQLVAESAKIMVDGLERISPAQAEAKEVRTAQPEKIELNRDISSLVAIVMLVIGIQYFKDCTVQPFIPIYLVVGGAIGILQCFIEICVKRYCKESKSPFVINGGIGKVISIFSLVWFIMGCVWVYSVKKVEFDDTTKDEYCPKTLYYFAFWYSSIILGLLGLMTTLALCYFCFVVCINVAYGE